jgi:HD-GYP domain-containing protein (c-di-GMP phosphodiesterase class II)
MQTELQTTGIEQAPCVPGYSVVSSSLIKALGASRCDLYRTVAWSAEPALYCAADVGLSDAQRSEMSRDNLAYLYVRRGDSARLQVVLRENMDDIVQRDDVPLEDRYNLVQSVVASEMKRLFHRIRLDDAMEDFDKLGGNVFNLISSGSAMPTELLAIAQHSAETFTHMINVSAYCVLTAEALGISDQNELKAIAKGGLLHDVGKRFMPRRLLNKETSFDEEEKRLIQTHPQKGYEELCRFESVCFGQRMMVYQHHEHIDGNGYPVRVTGKEMHLWSKICAVADVFEAMTGKRPYRKPEPIPQVVEYLEQSAGTHFDEEIVRCWSTIILKKS